MDHEEIYLLMMDALDEDLPEEGWISLEGHLQTCTACAQEWYALQAVETLLRTTPALAPPVDLVQRTLGRLPHPAYRTWVIGAIYGLLLLSGVIPLMGTVLLVTSVGAPLLDLTILTGIARTAWHILELLPVMLNALLNLAGAFVSEQPAIVGILLMMVGIIWLWGGVYSQLTTPQLATQQVRA